MSWNGSFVPRGNESFKSFEKAEVVEILEACYKRDSDFITCWGGDSFLCSVIKGWIGKKDVLVKVVYKEGLEIREVKGVLKKIDEKSKIVVVSRNMRGEDEDVTVKIDTIESILKILIYKEGRL